jgi:hypothetical protein
VDQHMGPDCNTSDAGEQIARDPQEPQSQSAQPAATQTEQTASSMTRILTAEQLHLRLARCYSLLNSVAKQNASAPQSIAEKELDGPAHE